MKQSIRDLLGELLRNEVFRDEDFISSNGIRCLILRESQNTGENELREFRIKNIPDDSAVFSLDYEHLKKGTDFRKQTDGVGVKINFICSTLSRFCSALKSDRSGTAKKIGLKQFIRNFSWLIIDNHRNAAKKCDIVIVTRDQKQINVIIGEFKSQRIIKSKIKEQLLNSHLILKYIFDLLEKYHMKRKIKINYNFVVFTNRKEAKNLNGKNLANLIEDSQRMTFVEVNNYDCIDFNDIV